MQSSRGVWMSAWLFATSGVWSQPQIQQPVPPPARVAASADGAECHFPFVYRNASHSECLHNQLGVKWCGLTADVDSDKRWRYCTQTPVVMVVDDDDDYDDDDNGTRVDEEDRDEDSHVLTVLDYASRREGAGTDPCKGMKCLFGGVCKLKATGPGSNVRGAKPGSPREAATPARRLSVCVCRPPFFGRHCNKMKHPCHDKPCRNGARCVLHPDDPARHACRCLPGFDGSNCEWKWSDPCEAPNPCWNGGVCSRRVPKGRRAAASCVCPREFTGPRCSIRTSDCYNGKGSDYGGTMSITEGRRPCLHWNSPWLLRQRHNALSPHARDSGLGDHNYCRNPDGGVRPWCYFRHKVEDGGKIDWAHCKLPQCQGSQQGPPRRVPPRQQGHHGAAAAACGRTWFGAVRVRVVNGREAGMGARPWQVSVQLRMRPHGEGTQGGGPHEEGGQPVHWCGGVLVHPCWVLTAAHCIPPKAPASAYLLRLGKRKLNAHEHGEQDFNVSKIIVHPGYSTTSYDADIALLRLRERAGACATVGTLEVVPACLPDGTEAPSAGTSCHVSGWGAVKHNGAMTPQLQEAEVRVVAMDACNSSLGYNGRITSRMLCAGNWEQEGPDACQGDSGGPLTCAVPGSGEEEERNVLHGIVSHGRSCGERFWPGVYTRVSAFAPWIRSSIGDDAASAVAAGTGGGRAGGGRAGGGGARGGAGGGRGGATRGSA